MEVGKLFVSLGVKGADKSLGAVTGLQKGLKETASVGLEAKAAIIGAMYALERLFSASGQRGTDLSNFNATLGMSAQTLQQYQYAAQQVGVSNDAVASSFKNLQATATKALMGEGAPKGMARVAQLTNAGVGEMQRLLLQATQGHPELLLQKLQEYARVEKNAGLRNETLESFGVGGIAPAINRQAFRPEVLNRAPAYSDKEIASLDKANAAWANLGTKIEMAVGHFNALHGGQLVSEITMITDKVLGLANALLRFSDKAHVFQLIGKSFEGWGKIFDTLTDNLDNIDTVFKNWGTIFEGIDSVLKSMAETSAGINDKGQPIELNEKTAASATDTILNMFGALQDMLMGASEAPGVSKADADRYQNLLKGLDRTKQGKDPNAFPGRQTGTVFPGRPKPSVAPKVPARKLPAGETPKVRLVLPPPPTAAATGASIAPVMPATASTGSSQNVEVNQTLNFNHDGADPHRTGDSVKRAIQTAFRQSSAQGQVT